MDHREPPFRARWSGSRQPSAKFLRLAHLRKLRRYEQVAAVCFRVRGEGIEFLLVQTRKARWTFPKGCAEPGLTHAQAAALEAFEEAGVHGRMEEASFTRYMHRKRGNRRSSDETFAVSAHLCEVLRLGPPQEFDRNPTWFTAEKAKRRLREDRASDHGAELARVIDRALIRIQRLRSQQRKKPDGPALDSRSLDGRSKDIRPKARLIEIDAARMPTARTKASATG